MNLMSLTAVELGKKIKSGEVTAVDATKAAWNIQLLCNCRRRGSTCRGF